MESPPFIGLVPSITAFLEQYNLQQPAMILYGVNFLLIAVMFNILRKYAEHEHKLAHGDAVPIYYPSVTMTDSN